MCTVGVTRLASLSYNFRPSVLHSLYSLYTSYLCSTIIVVFFSASPFHNTAKLGIASAAVLISMVVLRTDDAKTKWA